MLIKNFLNSYAVFAVAASAAACGTFDKKKSSSSSAPAEVTTEFRGEPIEQSVGSSVTVSLNYASNTVGATFKCATQDLGPNGPTGDLVWSSCPQQGSQLIINAGQRKRFSVKAVSPQNVEDATPVSVDLPKSAVSQDINTPAPAAFAVVINEAAAINGQTVSTSEVRLTFAAEGIPGGKTISDVRFECQSSSQSAFSQCSPDGAAQYSFGRLENGQSYQLNVQASVLVGGVRQVSDIKTISFTVDNVNQIALEEPNLFNSALTQNRTVRFSAPGVSQFTCAVEGASGTVVASTPCNGTVTLPIAGGLIGTRNYARMADGTYTLTITPNVMNGAGSSAPLSVSFCARQCSGVDGGAPEQMPNDLFLVGQETMFKIPQRMHVISLASNVTTTGFPHYMSVMNDPFTLARFECLGTRVSALSPSGVAFDYCSTQPNEALFKWMTDYRYANNHIEVATTVADPSVQVQERLLVNTFDGSYELMDSHSRFDRLCAHSSDVRKTDLVPAVSSFWAGVAIRAEIWTCSAWVANFSARGFERPSLWQIGAIFIADANGPGFRAPCGPNRACSANYSRNAIEAVFMQSLPSTDGTPIMVQPAAFARKVQDTFLSTIAENIN